MILTRMVGSATGSGADSSRSTRSTARQRGSRLRGSGRRRRSREAEHRRAQPPDLRFVPAAGTRDDLVEPHRIADLHVVLALRTGPGLRCGHVAVSFRKAVCRIERTLKAPRHPARPREVHSPGRMAVTCSPGTAHLAYPSRAHRRRYREVLGEFQEMRRVGTGAATLLEASSQTFVITVAVGMPGRPCRRVTHAHSGRHGIQNSGALRGRD